MQTAVGPLLFALLAIPGFCLVLKGPPADQVCDISSELAQAFVLSDDETIDGPVSDGDETSKAGKASETEVEDPVEAKGASKEVVDKKAGKASATEVEDPVEAKGASKEVVDKKVEDPVEAKGASKEGVDKKAALKDALGAYRQKHKQFQLAQAELMKAMEALLEVPAADDKAMKLFESRETGKDTLVVFYAPWCPHCQTFVLHDKKGNPENAPLEVFNRELKESNKDVSVLRVNVQNHQAALEKSSIFKVVGIPTVYFVNKAGDASQFKGNPHDTKALHKFIDDSKEAKASTKAPIY